MRLRPIAESIPRYRFPVEPWKLLETEHASHDLGVTETLFAIGNGYLGMRGNPSEGRDAHTHGTYLNGFHETWHIQHAEDAYAFAKTGQTIVNVPDPKVMKLYVDDEPLLLADAELTHYARTLDFRAGTSSRDVIWRTPSGKRVHVRTERMVSLEHRHLAVLQLEVTLLDGDAPVVISSQLLNRQDGEDEYYVTAAALGEGTDPRRARKFTGRVLQPKLQHHEPLLGDTPDPGGGRVTLGFRCTNSGMTVACAYRHELDTPCPTEIETTLADDQAKTVFTIEGRVGDPIRLTKYVSYHTSRGVPALELSDRCRHTLDRARTAGRQQLLAEQQAWLDGYWEHSDVEIDGDPAAQQAVRWALFQIAQATARAHEAGVAAKGVTAGGYDGHYFWDTEVYLLPMLAYTNPPAARKLLRFRYQMLGAARARAAELSQKGALYPWRTINGEEASAYYAAGTAQYHINAAVVYALERYLNATGDIEFLANEGAEMLVEAARLYEDLGFYASDGNGDGGGRFHIHSVTGPDEYTTVVNDNTYTNMMARFTMRYAADAVTSLREWAPHAWDTLVRRTGVDDDEIAGWHKACDEMFVPYDETLGIHPQDAAFLDRERWNFAGTPPEKYPLLLHFHPLVIYRYQVLKQADVVLAMFLRGEHIDVDTKRRNFDYYDPITTGDSSLSACVQSIVAAEVGYDDLAWQYFEQALYLDLADSHANTADGVHIANAGGVWAALVHGFAGFRDTGHELQFCPRLPKAWDALRFRLQRHGSLLMVEVTATGATVSVLSGVPVPLRVGDERITVAVGDTFTIPA